MEPDFPSQFIGLVSIYMAGFWHECHGSNSRKLHQLNKKIKAEAAAAVPRWLVAIVISSPSVVCLGVRSCGFSINAALLMRTFSFLFLCMNSFTKSLTDDSDDRSSCSHTAKLTSHHHHIIRQLQAPTCGKYSGSSSTLSAKGTMIKVTYGLGLGMPLCSWLVVWGASLAYRGRPDAKPQSLVVVFVFMAQWNAL